MSKFNPFWRNTEGSNLSIILAIKEKLMSKFNPFWRNTEIPRTSLPAELGKRPLNVLASCGEDEILVLGEQSTSSSEEQSISIAEVQDSEDDVYQPGPSKRMRINNSKSLPGRIPWKFDNNFTPKDFGFDRSHSGITDNFKLQVDSPGLVYFRHFLNKELVGGITEETNRYAETMKNKSMPSFSKWVNVNISEMYTFTALYILMGFIEKPALKDYCSTNPVIETPFFAKVCSRDRFLQILYALHFANNANLDKNDALRKIRPTKMML
ncbi:Transposase IS4 [Popillia japonica]|uniref:Transposase IS4 n=1 Tax=Popillia japonica TaxID=7064 RepID=A0AAW1ICV8_POPJA